MNFGDGYDYEEVDRAYIAGMDDGEERGYNVGYTEGYQDGIRAAVDTTERGPEWVRTEDRLPTVKDGTQNADVLAVWTFPKPHQVVAVSWRTVCESDEFTYWMPLPKLPEVGK